MALVQTGFYMSVSLIDNGGNRSTLQYHMRDATYVLASASAPIVIAELQAVTDSVIESWSLQERFGEDSFAYPASGVENENKASITVQLAGAGNGKANIKIPAPKPAIFMDVTGPGANQVDVTDTDVLDYVALFQAAGKCYISDGETALQIVSGKRISAKNNNG